MGFNWCWLDILAKFVKLTPGRLTPPPPDIWMKRPNFLHPNINGPTVFAQPSLALVKPWQLWTKARVWNVYPMGSATNKIWECVTLLEHPHSKWKIQLNNLGHWQFLFGSVGSLEAAHVSKSVRVVFKTVNLLQELAHLKQIEIEPGTLQNRQTNYKQC